MISFLQILSLSQNFYHLFLWLISLLLIGKYFFSWYKIAQFNSTNFKASETHSLNEKMPNISVIIPFRNEAHRIIPLLNSIQETHLSLKEFIIARDDSSRVVNMQS